MKQTIDGLILYAKTMVKNARDIASILAEVSRYGYSAEVLTNAEAVVERLEELHVAAKKERGEQKAATARLHEARAVLDKAYTRKVKLARATIKQPDALTALQLTGRRKNALPAWLAQVKAFYGNALQMPAVLEQLGELNITREMLEAGLVACDELESLRRAQLKETGEAQSATEARDLVLDEVKEWLSRFEPIVKVALEDNPQMLEALGIKTSKSGSSTYGDEDEDEDDEEGEGEGGGLQQT